MRRILIIKIGAIGDVIMTLPVITEIKKQYPDSHITWICGEVVLPILINIPDISEVISIDNEKLFNSNKYIASKELFSYLRKVAFRRFDSILNFHPDSRYRLLTLLLRARLKARLCRSGERPSLIPGRSRAFEQVRLFMQTDTNNTGNLDFPRDIMSFSNVRGEIARFITDDRPIAILAPGGAKNTLHEQALKRWPITNYVLVAAYLLQRNFKVVLSGAESDSWIEPYFAHLNLINLVGKSSIPDLVSIMRKSSLVITHDSGPFHLSVFARTPNVIVLFGPTNPNEFTYGPGYSRIKYLWEGRKLLCSPCYYGKHFSTQCDNNICMQQNLPEQVFQLIDELFPAG